MDVPDSTIYKLGISENQLRSTLYNYPNYFVRVNDQVHFVDSAYVQQYYEFTFPLIEMSLENEFRKDSIINLNALFDGNNEIGNLMKMNIILKYLSTQKDKFLLLQDRTVLPGKVLLQKK